VWLAIGAVVMLTACGPKQVSSPARPGQDLIVLLPDPDSQSIGGARVSNSLGAVDLAAERDAAVVGVKVAPVPAKLTDAEVKNIFGDALSALPPAIRRFTLYFRFESDTLTDESRALIPQVLAAANQHAVQDVVVIGHTDTMGAQRANYALGLKRAMTVKNLLVAAGLRDSAIEVTSVGELDPLVKTPDQTPEARNRRVEIAVR
jgi:outer membrane protein OmpA-like peptidoglycan-associated protein